jgi:hypothetical protein
MFDLLPTKHAVTRMAQRAILMSDVELIAAFGTGCPDGYILLERDCDELERELKASLQRLAQLRGTRLVADGSRLITAYRATDRKIKSLRPGRSQKRRSMQ